MAHILPKTLAKTLTYIGYLAPGEYGLFWDEDGTMPWKEFHWVLQQDPTLRFVREATLRELGYLGCGLPFELVGKRLRILDAEGAPRYSRGAPPKRLYYGCPQPRLLAVETDGLRPFSRKYVALTANRRLAETMARRRDPTPLVIEVLAEKACHEGTEFRTAGADLFLVAALPPQYLVFPFISDEKRAALGKTKPKDKGTRVAESSPAPGSFPVETRHLEDLRQGQGMAGKGAGKEGKKADWKRASRKTRGKRTI
jgi:putative RNA 2'-phosphotransferase